MQPTPVFLPRESMDRGAWWATVDMVAKNQTRLKQLNTQHISIYIYIIATDIVHLHKSSVFAFCVNVHSTCLHLW